MAVEFHFSNGRGPPRRLGRGPPRRLGCCRFGCCSSWWMVLMNKVPLPIH